MNENASTTAPTPPPAHHWRFLPWLLVSILLCACSGTALLLIGTDELIQSITVTKRGGTVIDVGNFLSDQPDLYLILELDTGPVELKRFEDSPIGNGLTWTLDPNVRRDLLREVTIWDDDFMRDDCLDRVSPSEWKVEGQRFVFEFTRRPSTMRPWLIGAAGVCGLMLVITGGLFVRDQVL